MKSFSASPIAIVAVTAVLVAISSLLPAVEASLESTCQAAAAHDRRVDVPFCMSRLAAYRGVAEVDVWGLAKAAAFVGINLSDDAKFDIGNGKVAPPPASGAGGKAAVEACAMAYDAIGMAVDELDARRYAAAKGKLAGVAAIARRCEGGFTVVGARTPPALAKYAVDCQKMAVIGTAITNLIK